MNFYFYLFLLVHLNTAISNETELDTGQVENSHDQTQGWKRDLAVKMCPIFNSQVAGKENVAFD